MRGCGLKPKETGKNNGDGSGGHVPVSLMNGSKISDTT
jgi:hypothetical protein